jgi:hypothetical protein
VCTYVINRQGSVRNVWPDTAVHPKDGDIIILKNKKRTRKYVYSKDTCGMYHCGTKCSITRAECVHYDLGCTYHHYLRPVEDVMEEL